MSTFNGVLEEIPGISVDQFENCNSSAFFLSHCHSDHIKGLSKDFFKSISNKKQYFYCSGFTKSYLQHSFSLEDELNNVVALQVDDPIVVEYDYCNLKKSFSVCAITAGHSPGSIMFLFTLNSNRNILYTGDFRINIEDYPNIKKLHVSDKVIELEKIYLDTTFLNLSYKNFPTRREGLAEIKPLIVDWLKKDYCNIVVLEISANFGSENLFKELSTLLKTKIHVSDKTFSVYKSVQGMKEYVTNIGHNTRVHACRSKILSKQKFTCKENVNENNILTIIPSVRKWEGRDTSCVIERDVSRKQTVNICYSCHPSYEEIILFIKYFKPKNVHACVCPSDRTDEIKELLKKLTNYCDGNEISIKRSSFTIHDSRYRPFKKTKYRPDIGDE